MDSMDAKRIRGLSVRDIRFPTALEGDGTDAVHSDPDYSCAYVIIYTDAHIRGHGLTFTLGRGTELVVTAVKSLSSLIVGKSVTEIFTNFSSTWRDLTSETQMRWVGPEKGVIHLATAAIVNALFDLWARMHQKPLWKFLVDMEPEELVSTIDFRYIEDVLTKDEAIQMLREMEVGKEEREDEMLARGYPAYTTAAGWLGYSGEKVSRKVNEFMAQGWKHFKIKVGSNLEDDKIRCAAVRREIGDKNVLMVDANQKWGVKESIEWMKKLAPYKPLWIEEPTSPDDVLGHGTIKKALAPYGIGVATGEMCQNRVMFKQFFQNNSIDFCQLDAARLGGVPEVLAVYLMAKKFDVPVCPHGGGVGLCQMIPQLQIWDYISVSGTKKKRLIEYVNHLEEHFKFPIKMKGNHYLAPRTPGYNTEMWFKSLADYEYPNGPAWKQMFKQGLYRHPNSGPPPYIETISPKDDIIKDR